MQPDHHSGATSDPRARLGRRLLGLAGALGLGLLLLLLIAFAYLRSDLPTIRTLADYQPAQATHVYSDDGHLLSILAMERRTVVPIEAIPRHVVLAFLAAEDAGFYEHAGLDYLGILRAAYKNLRPGAHLQGASTITQQIVKTLVLGPERSYVRKMREAILARELEQLLTKEGILHLYLNQIYFGSGAYGVEQAARTYFGKSVRELDLGEAALLAAIPKNPSRYTLKADPGATKERQQYVLSQMAVHGWADPAQAAMESSELLPAPFAGPPFLGKAPHAVEQVRRLLIERYGEHATYQGGLSVYTGILAEAQVAAHEALRRGIEDLERKYGYGGATLRVEVDRLRSYREALHAAFAMLRDQATAVWGSRSPRLPWIWDLSSARPENLSDAESFTRSLNLVPLEEGRRVTALVSEIDSMEDIAWVDLGGCRGRLTLKSMEWARRFSATEDSAPPRDPADVVHSGDLVVVDVTDVPVRLLQDNSELVVSVELVPEPRVQGALVAVDPHTRLVRALVGGYSLETAGLIRAVQSRRQPGSAFKPLVYALGLETHTITPATLCQDTPVVFRDPWTGKAWKPDNYEDGRYDGTITYRTALLRSKNTCSVKLIEKLGPENVITLAHAMGITSELPNNLTLALGTGEVSPWELASAYASIAAGGVFAPPNLVRKVVDQEGQILDEWRSEPTQVLKPAAAYVLSHMMRSVVEEGTATRALILDRPLAGKTGTSDQARDAWFAGFSAELVAVVWVGFDDNKPLGRQTGGSAALPIWIRFMGRALEGLPRRDFAPPDDVVFMRVDADTGFPSMEVGNIEEAFLSGTEPQEGSQPLPSIFMADEPENGQPRPLP